MNEQKNNYDPYEYKPQPQIGTKPKIGFWRTFFIIIGIIALIIILIIVGVIITLIVVKPFGLDVTKLPAAVLESNSNAPSTYDHPALSNEQEQLLESLGVDTSTLPTEITPAQEQCAVSALGQARVDEIKAGATPGLSDYLKAKHCLE